MGTIADLLKEIPLSAVLREKVLNLESENAALQTENAILKGEIRKSQAENKRLTEEINRLTLKVELEETEIKILVHAGKSTDSFDVERVASTLQLKPVEVKYFVEELRKKGFVAPASFIRGQPPRFRLDQKGREYIIKNDLI